MTFFINLNLNLIVTNRGFKIEEFGDKELAFDKKYVIDNISFKIKPNFKKMSTFTGTKIIIQKENIKSVVSQLIGNVNAGVLNEESDVVVLSMKGLNQTKSRDIINCLIKVYNEDGIKDRQLASKNNLVLKNSVSLLLQDMRNYVKIYKACVINKLAFKNII